jgi:hypothetical protein
MSRNQFEALLILGPIIGLLTLGMGLTLRSGVVSVSTGQGMRRFAANLSQTILIIFASLILLVVIQQIAGIRMNVVW